MSALAWFLLGCVTGSVVSFVVLALLRFATEGNDDPAADALWDEPWPPRPDPVTEVTPTPAEQAALFDAVVSEPVALDVDELIREVEDLIRRKARP